MDAKKGHRQPPSAPGKSVPPPARRHLQQRKIGVIVRDDRDAASVEWVDAPSDYARVQLSLEGAKPAAPQRPAATGYDPYETLPKPRAAPGADKKPAKRDLRKLSEWIKQMRELEERKKSGEDS